MKRPTFSPKSCWALMQKLMYSQNSFTVTELQERFAPQAHTKVRRYVLTCEALGHLSCSIPRKKKRPATTTLFRMNDVDGAAPEPDSLQKPVVNPSTQQIWTAMRTLRTFELRELQFAASTENHAVSIELCTRYIRALKRVGIVTVVVNGGSRRPWTYRLRASANTGPYPPKLLRHGVLDQNTEAVVTTVRQVAA